MVYSDQYHLKYPNDKDPADPKPRKLFSGACLSILITFCLSSNAFAAETFNQVMAKAGILRATNQDLAALPFFAKAVEMRPKSAEAHGGLGWTLFRLGNLDKAQEEAELAIDLDPKCADCHQIVAIIYYAKGMMEEARQEFKTALILDPKKHCRGCNSMEIFLGAEMPRTSGGLIIPDFKKAMEEKARKAASKKKGTAKGKTSANSNRVVPAGGATNPKSTNTKNDTKRKPAVTPSVQSVKPNN